MEMGYSDSKMAVASLVLCMVVVGSAVDVVMAGPSCEEQCIEFCNNYYSENDQDLIPFCGHGPSPDLCNCKRNKGTFIMPKQ